MLLCEPLESIIALLFYSTSSINLVINLYEFNIFITYPEKELLIVKKINFYTPIMQRSRLARFCIV